MSAPAALHVSGLRKLYGDVVALDRVTLTAPAGGILALLGPSGSGKTTILMTVAGFETPDEGSIRFDDRDITRLAPHRRGIGMVFQRYALFPHMTVAENVAYPLRQRGVSRADRDIQVRGALDLVQLGNFGGRLPAQLSGGQQQRIALARALVYRPPVLLLDEPLGALDRKLREQLQIEIKQLQRRLGTTMVLVTHDQQEALSMADHVVLLRSGRIEQAGSPWILHERPASAFVADFVGEANRIRGNVEADGTRLRASTGLSLAGTPCDSRLCDGQPAELVVRPSRVALGGASDHPARVTETVYGGETATIVLDFVGTTILARRPASEPGWVIGEAVRIKWAAEHAWLFPAERAG